MLSCSYFFLVAMEKKTHDKKVQSLCALYYFRINNFLQTFLCGVALCIQGCFIFMYAPPQYSLILKKILTYYQLLSDSWTVPSTFDACSPPLCTHNQKTEKTKHSLVITSFTKHSLRSIQILERGKYRSNESSSKKPPSILHVEPISLSPTPIGLRESAFTHGIIFFLSILITKVYPLHHPHTAL